MSATLLAILMPLLILIFARAHAWAHNALAQAFPIPAAILRSKGALHPIPYLYTLYVLYRVLTAPLRVLPDVLIVGAAKAGTTSIASYLAQHPHVLTCPWKESRIMVGMLGDGLAHRRWAYRAAFPTVFEVLYVRLRHGRWPCVFDCDPLHALHAPFLAPRLHAIVPDAHVILQLREPVARLWSQYRMIAAHAGGNPELPTSFTVEEAVALERRLQVEHADLWAALDGGGVAPDAPLPPSFSRATFNSLYLRPGMYALALRAFRARFARVTVLKFDEMVGREEAFCRGLYRLVGVDDAIALGALEAVKPEDEFQMVKRADNGRMSTVLDDALAAELKAYFAPHNRELYELLGEDLGW